MPGLHPLRTAKRETAPGLPVRHSRTSYLGYIGSDSIRISRSYLRQANLAIASLLQYVQDLQQKKAGESHMELKRVAAEDAIQARLRRTSLVPHRMRVCSTFDLSLQTRDRAWPSQLREASAPRPICDCHAEKGQKGIFCSCLKR